MSGKSIFLYMTLLLTLWNTQLHAQAIENAGWLFLNNQHRLNSKIDLLTDLQLRSADDYQYVHTVLFRNAVSYRLNEQQSVAIGYAYKGDWEKEADYKQYTLEHRLFEQYNFETTFKRIELTLRARLEQRFIKEQSFIFSQRGRAFISAQIPLVSDNDFSYGLYLKLQNELFLNVTNKDKVNGNTLEQNRPLVALGYRFNKSLDMDFGYMRWFQRQKEGDFKRNILQLMITTGL